MMKALSLTMCLMLPISAFAQDAAPPSPPPPPAADQPVQSGLVPKDAAAANGATEGTRSCGMAKGCAGKRHGAGKLILLTGVIGTIVTAAAVGIAVGVARSQPTNGQVPR